MADTTLTKGKWKVPAYSFGSEELFSLNSKKMYRFMHFILYVKQNQRGNSHDDPQNTWISFIHAFVDKKINEAAGKSDYKKTPDFEMLLKEYYEGILLFDIMEKEVWKKASEDSSWAAEIF